MSMIHILKTTLGILCTVSFLSGCVAAQLVKVDDDPNKSSGEVVTNEELPASRAQLTNDESFPPRVQLASVESPPPKKKRQSNAQLHSKKQLQLMYMNYLKKEGYVPKIDSDGDIKFKKEGDNYYIYVGAQQKDPQFFRVQYYIGKIENNTERQKAILAANHANAVTKVVKFYVLEDTAWVTVQIFVSNVEDFEDIFPRVMSVISAGMENFKENFNEQ